MKQYQVIITFNDGDQIQSKVAAWNQSDALQRIMSNKHATEFITSHDDVKNVDITCLGDWLRLYHADILEERGEASRYINRKRIGQLIAEARRKQGLTLRELAEKSGVSYQNITKIENGRYNVSIDILGKLCRALYLKIDLSGI